MCVFCEIVKGNIPSYKVYEDDLCIAILDISQATLGHTLVLPKKHFDDILSIDEDTLTHLSLVVNKLVKHYSTALNVTDFNIINNCGELAGQTVKHFHIHILPRYEGDTVKMEFTFNDTSENEFKHLVSKLSLK